MAPDVAADVQEWMVNCNLDTPGLLTDCSDFKPTPDSAEEMTQEFEGPIASTEMTQAADSEDDDISVISDGESESDTDSALLQEWCMDVATVDYVKRFTSLLLASGCAMNSLLTYQGGCKMIANIQAICDYVASKTTDLALRELWGWLASVMKVSSATKNLLEQLKLLDDAEWDRMATHWATVLETIMKDPSWNIMEFDEQYNLELKCLSGGFLSSIKGIKSMRNGFLGWLLADFDPQNR